MRINSATNLYFVAILCPEEISRQITTYKHLMKERYGCKAALKSPPHITLVPPFRINSELHDQVVSTLRTFAPLRTELNITLRNFDHFNKRVLYVKVIESTVLTSLKEQTENHFRQTFGTTIKIEERNFHPHVTIANRDLNIDDFEDSWRHFSTIPFNATSHATDICLLQIINGIWQPVAFRQIPSLL